jgi:hypothetical protein
MEKERPLHLGIDHKKKRLVMRIGTGDKKVSAGMGLKEIADFMALLSHAQYVLARSTQGHGELNLPIDPMIAFQPVAGQFRIGMQESIAQLVIGDDPTTGEVILTLLGGAGRISGFRMSPDMAQQLGQGLLDSAEKASTPQTKQ